MAEIGGTILFYGAEVAEGLTFFEVLLSLRNTGMLMNFSYTIKFISKFRFISVYFGDLLESFLAGGGKGVELHSRQKKNLILENRTASRGKLALYKQGITTVDILHYKTILYVVSFLFRLAEKGLLRLLWRKRTINKFIFYIIYFHNKIHFVLLNVFISGGEFLNLRTLLHMKMIPTNGLFKFDKIIAVFCFFFYWIDICEMFLTCLIMFRNTTRT